MRKPALVVIALAMSMTPTLSAQEAQRLTADDSASIRVTALRALFQHLNVDTTRMARLWIVTHESSRSGPGGAGNAALTQQEHAAIRTAFPVARTADAMGPLFQCPPGVQVRMPGQGCPIRENGIIVRFTPIQVDGDTIRTGGKLIQSAPGGRGTITWAAGYGLVFVRVGDAWIFRGVHLYWET